MTPLPDAGPPGQSERASIEAALLEIRPLAHEDVEAARSFSCGDADLDDFLLTDAVRLQDQNIVRTYVASYEGELVGYVALLVDAVELRPNERKKLALHFRDHPIVPALKIARIAVSAAFRARRRGAGEALVFYAYSKAHELAERVGCRLLTLDAYPESLAFYERLGFVRNGARVYESRTRPSMRFDLFASETPNWIIRWSGPADAVGS